MSDRDRADFQAAVESVLPPLDYFRSYGAKVVAQAGDKTLEVVCDDDRIGGLSKVPIRHGLPGVEVQVSAGARVRVLFEEGDPQQPFAALFDTNAALVEITFDSGTQSVARVDDTVDCGTFVFFFEKSNLPLPGLMDEFHVQYNPPGGPPGIPLPVIGAKVESATPVPIVIPVSGLITSGAAKVKA